MDLKLVCLLIFLLGLALQIEAEFFYDPKPPKESQLEERGLKCMPGRTVMRMRKHRSEHKKRNSDEEYDDIPYHMSEKIRGNNKVSGENDTIKTRGHNKFSAEENTEKTKGHNKITVEEDTVKIIGHNKITAEGDTVKTKGHNKHSEEDVIVQAGRRTHMMSVTTDESCEICVCSAEGKDEDCSKRPAKNVNECMRMAKIVDEFKKNIPFDHLRSLSFRVRRLGDYLWHNDEIPYDPDAKCKRGFSYYTNSQSAADTDIDVATDVESLLDYSIKSICYFCICSADGYSVACLHRELWVCDYFRESRAIEDYPRQKYADLFKQDRPRYFRQLSFRMRRNMDVGLVDFVEMGGDALCCSHPNGHRRKLQADVRNRLRQLRRKIPSENLMSGGPNGDYVDFIVNNDK